MTSQTMSCRSLLRLLLNNIMKDTLQKQISNLTRRVEELERRPVYVPYPVQQPITQPWNPNVWPNHQPYWDSNGPTCRGSISG